MKMVRTVVTIEILHDGLRPPIPDVSFDQKENSLWCFRLNKYCEDLAKGELRGGVIIHAARAEWVNDREGEQRKKEV